jgi:single-strand DNA-binding protein
LANINQTYLLGNLTKDPELKYTNEGMAIAEMGMAVNKKWRDLKGEENISVDYFNITAWNNLAENCAVSLKKGDRIIVGGHLNLRTWENKEGKKYNLININADVIALSLEFNTCGTDKNPAAPGNDTSVAVKRRSKSAGSRPLTGKESGNNDDGGDSNIDAPEQ